MDAKVQAGMTIGDPWADAPTPDDKWLKMSEAERKVTVQNSLPGSYLSNVLGISGLNHALPDGRVIVTLAGGLNAKERGEWLRRIEKECKDKVDPAIIIELAPQVDRNAVRRFRGVVR